MLMAFFRISRCRRRYSISFCCCLMVATSSSGSCGPPSSFAGARLLRYFLRHLIKKRIDTTHGQWLQRRRQTVAEGAFGFIKQTLGFQRFTLRGLEKVQTEWQLVCLAFNLRKLA